MKNKIVLKILAGLVVFSLTAPVFAKANSKKVNRAVVVNSFTIDDLVQFGRKECDGSMSQRLLKEIRQNKVLKNYIKKNKIYTAKKVYKNFSEILGKAIEGKKKIIEENKKKIGKMDEKEIKKEFKKDMKESVKYFKKVLSGQAKLEEKFSLDETKLKKQIKNMEDAIEKCDGKIFKEYKSNIPRYLKISLAQHKKDIKDLEDLKENKTGLGFVEGIIGALFKNNKNLGKKIKKIVN